MYVYSDQTHVIIVLFIHSHDEQKWRKSIENNLGDEYLIDTLSIRGNLQVVGTEEKSIENSMKQLLEKEQEHLLAEINKKIMRKKYLMMPDSDNELLK